MNDAAVNVHARIEDGLARITLDRPPVNVLTIAMMRELAAAIRRAGASSDVRVVRLDAVGKAFSAGVDVGEHMGDFLPAMMEAFDGVFRAFEEVAQPVVAVVHGAALGGGCEVVLGADVCLASEKATFGQPEIRLGVFAPPASVLLPRIVGERRSLGLLLSGETISAAEAERIGLVNKVFPDTTFPDEADDWIAGLLRLSGPVLALAKRAVSIARGRGPREAHGAVSRLYMDTLMKTEDAHEGLRSFMEKRAPSWKHR